MAALGHVGVAARQQGGGTESGRAFGKARERGQADTARLPAAPAMALRFRVPGGEASIARAHIPASCP